MQALNLEQKLLGTASFSLSGEFYDPDENKINMSLSGTSVTITQKVVTPPQTGGTTGGNAGGTTSPGGTTNPGTTKPSVTNPGSNAGGTTNNNTQTNLSSNANLKTMQIGAEGISPGFNKNITEYWLVVNETVENINVVATPEDSNATVSISGNQNLQIGSNKILITVTAQNKTQKVYTINVTKTEDMNKANANLENLAIENVTIIPEFSADITEYTAQVESQIENLNILAIPQIEEATVNIEKPEILNFGENIITITVLAKDGITQKSYTINVNRKQAEEQNFEQSTKDNQEPEKKQKDYIFLAIILVSITGIIVGLIRKYIKETKI